MAYGNSDVVRKSNTWSGVANTALVIALIGAINWGLIGFFNWNLVAAIFGEGSALSRVIYALVGICGVIGLVFLPKLRVIAGESRLSSDRTTTANRTTTTTDRHEVRP